MMKNEIIENKFIERAMALQNESAELGTAFRLYEFELLSEKNTSYGDIENIRNMVESTSHVLEKMYRDYENRELGLMNNIDKGVYDETIFEIAVFSAVMCIGSRVYENLDPVFSRDIMHAALDAAHFLISRQFKEADDENDETNERDSVIRMSSRDDDLSSKTVTALMLAFTELLKTDKDIRNAYDHSLMAGMPQKMSRQKRYKLRLSDMSKRLSYGGGDLIEESMLLLVAAEIMLDSEDTYSEEVKKPVRDFLYKAADENGNVLNSVIAILSLQNELEIDEGLNSGSSQLIKVVEYNVIGGNRKRMTEDERNAVREHIERLEKTLN